MLWCLFVGHTPLCTLQMLSYGCTRLEIGLQSIFEDVARDTNRGHTVAAVGECFHLAKNAGFKVIAHMMPDLPNMGWERDMESFREFFENPDFRTDGLKVPFRVPYCHMVTLYSDILNIILLACLLQDQILLVLLCISLVSAFAAEAAAGDAFPCVIKHVCFSCSS